MMNYSRNLKTRLFKIARSLQPLVVISAALCVSNTALASTEFRWTGAAGDEDWTNPFNWFNETLNQPNMGYPTLIDTVYIDSDISISQGQAYEMYLSNGVHMTNNVLLQVDRLLELDNAHIDQTKSLNGSTLELTGTFSQLLLKWDSSIEGGRIFGNHPRSYVYDGGFTGGKIKDVTLDGTLFIKSLIEGEITLDSTINFGGGSSSFGNDGVAIFENQTTYLQGNGSMELGSEHLDLDRHGRVKTHGDEGRGTLVNNLVQGISGTGEFKNIHLVNNTTINPTGGIRLVDATLDNTNGQINIGAGKRFGITANSSVFGGTIHGERDGEEYAQLYANGNDLTRNVLEDVTLTGHLQIGPIGSQVRDSIIFRGLTTNNSVLVSAADGTRTPGILVHADETSTFTGSGEIVLQGDALNTSNGSLRGLGFDSVFVNQNHLIRGEGIITALTLVNNGLLLSDSGSLLLDRVWVTNDNGHIEIEGDSELRLGSSYISGGIINGQKGARFIPALFINNDDATLENVTLTGEFTFGEQHVSSPGFVTRTAIWGTLTNNAYVEVTHSENDASNPGHNFYIGSNSASTLTGTGEINLHASAYGGFLGTGSDRSTLIHEQPHTISGAGTIDRLKMIHRGAMHVNDGSMRFTNSIIDSTGIIEVSDTGSINLMNTSFAADSITLADKASFNLDFSSTLEANLINGNFEFDSGDFAAGRGLSMSIITGDYAQLSEFASLKITVDDGTHDSLHIMGNANLSGNLIFAILNEDAISYGDIIEIMTIDGSLNGNFLGLNEGDFIRSIGGGASNDGLDLFITYQAGTGNSIAIIAIPSPGVLPLVAAGLLGFVRPCRSKISTFSN